jgi:hypothetical protein
MRNAIIVWLCFTSVPVLADPPDIAYASGFALDDTKIVIRMTSAASINPDLTFVRADARGNQLSAYFLVEKECKWHERKYGKTVIQSLACRVNRKSPLSGVSYQVINELGAVAPCGRLAYTLRCTSGCTSRSIPKEIYVETC